MLATLDTVPHDPFMEQRPDEGDASAKPACANLQGIVRRVAAFAIDMIPFTLVAVPVAHLFPGAVMAAYPWSRLVALPLIVLFRGAFQATVGRTPGQRLLGLRVTLRDGRPPTFGRAVVRNTIAVLPLVMNGFAPPGLPLGSVAWTVFAAFTIFGVGLGSGYLLLCNRATRQSLHDSVTGTFVWYGPGSVVAPPSTSLPKLHAAVLALLALVFTVSPFLALRALLPSDGLRSLTALRDDVLTTGKYQDVGVNLATSYSPQGTQRVLSVTLVGRFDQALLDAQVHDVTALVRARKAELPPVDRLVVQRTEAYDLFFASATRSEWKTVSLAEAPAPGDIR